MFTPVDLAFAGEKKGADQFATEQSLQNFGMPARPDKGAAAAGRYHLSGPNFGHHAAGTEQTLEPVSLVEQVGGLERHMALRGASEGLSARERNIELVLLAGHRARMVSQGAPITVDRDNDKNPVVALREIADEAQSAEVLRERMIESYQTQIEVDEPEDDQMALLMGGEMARPMVDDMSEEKLLRALMEAQGEF